MSQPSTLEECMTEFTVLLSKEEQMEFLRMPKEELIMLHHGFGMWLRNNWGLWKEESPLYKHMKELGFCHPDDMSQALIVEFWNRLNNQPSELQEDIQRSKKWAEKSKNEAK